jgi:hypothetical protein
MSGIDLSKIKYDTEGNMIFDEENEQDNNETNIDTQPVIKSDFVKIKNLPKNATSEMRATALSQTMEEMENDMMQQKLRQKEIAKEHSILTTKKNIMFLTILIFTILGLSVGTFVIPDYITTTLIGLVLGVVVGHFLCKK